MIVLSVKDITKEYGADTVLSGITFGVNEPLNAKLRTVEPTTAADFAAARAQLEEGTWAAWNTVRAVACTLAFGCLTWALAIHRRLR